MPNRICRDTLWMHGLEADTPNRNLPTVSVFPSSRHPPRTPQMLSKPSLPWPDRLRKGWELRPRTTSLRYKSVKAKEFSPAPLGAAANLVVWDYCCIGRQLGTLRFIRAVGNCAYQTGLEQSYDIELSGCTFPLSLRRNGHPPTLDLRPSLLLAHICRLD
jgi:hypothetical protein